MRVQTLNISSIDWDDRLDEASVRVVIDGTWYCLNKHPEGGLEVHTEHPINVCPNVSNSITIRTL